MEEFSMNEHDEFVDFEVLNEDLRPLELKFPEDKTDLMIDAIRQRAALWNIKDLNYRNRVVRNSLWQEVLYEMGKILVEKSLEILKDMNKSRTTPTQEKSFAALTCELICKDMETVPDSEQTTLRTELFATVDAAIRRNRSPGQ